MGDPSGRGMAAPENAEPPPAKQPARRGVARATAPRPEICRAAIWIGVEPCRPHEPYAQVPAAVAEKIAAFIDTRFPGAQVDARRPASFCLRCVGSLAQVMHIADDVGWHVRGLSGTDELEAFDARLGIVIASAGETVTSLLHRAEDAAETLARR